MWDTELFRQKAEGEVWLYVIYLQVLVQRQEAEQELNHKIEKMQGERQTLQERVQALQRALATIETEKREYEREQARLEKDKAALQKTLDKVCVVNSPDIGQQY